MSGTSRRQLAVKHASQDWYWYPNATLGVRESEDALLATLAAGIIVPRYVGYGIEGNDLARAIWRWIGKVSDVATQPCVWLVGRKLHRLSVPRVVLGGRQRERRAPTDSALAEERSQHDECWRVPLDRVGAVVVHGKLPEKCLS
jgi:hypothetical protein